MSDETAIEPPYLTRDFAEAVTLATCGVPFVYPEQRMIHLYRATRLRELGLTAREAIDQNIEGEKTWVFVNSPECQVVAEAFKQAWAAPKTHCQTLPQINLPELALGIATALRNRKELSGDWKYVAPHVAIEREGGGTTIITENTHPDVLDRFGINQ